MKFEELNLRKSKSGILIEEETKNSKKKDSKKDKISKDSKKEE